MHTRIGAILPIIQPVRFQAVTSKWTSEYELVSRWKFDFWQKRIVAWKFQGVKRPPNSRSCWFNLPRRCCKKDRFARSKIWNLYWLAKDFQSQLIILRKGWMEAPFFLSSSNWNCLCGRITHVPFSSHWVPLSTTECHSAWSPRSPQQPRAGHTIQIKLFF